MVERIPWNGILTRWMTGVKGGNRCLSFTPNFYILYRLFFLIFLPRYNFLSRHNKFIIQLNKINWLDMQCGKSSPPGYIRNSLPYIWEQDCGTINTRNRIYLLLFRNFKLRKIALHPFTIAL